MFHPMETITYSAPPKEYAFYVSPDGNDAASGTNPGNAFATLQRARDAIRQLKKTKALPKGGVTVSVRFGRYYLDQTFELTSEDSGTAEAPIVYRAMPGERVRVIGGRQVAGWQKVQEQAILDRLDPAARGKVYQADLRAQGIDDFGLRTTQVTRFCSPDFTRRIRIILPGQADEPCPLAQ